MGILTHDERRLADLISSLAYCNPFLPKRVELERQILGERFVELGAVWHARAAFPKSPNVACIGELASAVIHRIGSRRSGRLQGRDRTRYRDLVYYALYHRYLDEFSKIVVHDDPMPRPVAFFRSFAKDHESMIQPMRPTVADDVDPTHLFACFFQIRRAFHHIFEFILGGSMAAAKLRAAVWQSIFTHDLQRYQRCLFDKMGDIVTLVTGPTGTGKELVARAVGHSRYLPFRLEQRTFAAAQDACFFALNLSALSPTLIESELFGHRRGAFTGAVQDRAGWLEVCPEHGTVFLDEIGEIDPCIQVKLLRVLQSRTFQRLGETKDRCFRGKLVAATNRNPSVEMAQRRIREDFYYRLCADRIITPSLRDQIGENPDELRHLLRVISRRFVGEGNGDADALAEEAFTWIARELGLDYAWPGNVRELEQCVRNIMIRGSYVPVEPSREDLSTQVLEQWYQGGLTLNEVIRSYCRYVYQKTGNYVEAGARLGVDRRTLKAKVLESGDVGKARGRKPH